MNEIDTKYKLTGTCVGCMRVSWLCRRNRRCSRYKTTARSGFVATPTGFARENQYIQFADGVLKVVVIERIEQPTSAAEE